MATVKLGLLQPGDLVFVHGTGWMSRLIVWFQRFWDPEKHARLDHVFPVLSTDGQHIETTALRTRTGNLADYYAGSDLTILRLHPMKTPMAARGLRMVASQEGRLYPYWRLLMHLLGLACLIHGRGMECSALAAHYLSGAGIALKRSPWCYSVAMLSRELRSRTDCKVVFKGSLRAGGWIEG